MAEWEEEEEEATGEEAAYLELSPPLETAVGEAVKVESATAQGRSHLHQRRLHQHRHHRRQSAQE